MANQGLLAQLKPTANTDTVLYRAPIDKSASTVLTIETTELDPLMMLHLKIVIKN